MTWHFDYHPSASEWRGHQYRWLAGGYDLELDFLEVASSLAWWLRGG